MTRSETVGITRADATDADILAAALARAFLDDPVFEWVIRDPGRRRKCLPAAFAAFVDVYLPHDESYLAGDGIGGALWASPGIDPMSGHQLEVFAERIGAALQGDADRAFEIAAILEHHHPAEPCFYLQFLGVVPEQQGRGIGSRLLATVLERCDAAGTPAYLEATSADNHRFYERNGFRTIRVIPLPDGPALWSMWRDPAGARSPSTP